MAEQKSPSSPKLEGNELIEALKKQIEYYFSNANLKTDNYLVSVMNTDLFVPVKIIAGFPKIVSLTDDSETVLKAIRECDSIRLSPDGQMVRPNIKSQRNTLILREISSSVDSKEVSALLGDQFGKLEVKSDIGDCWYVYFENDEHAVAALEHLRTKTFAGEPVKARLKTESTLKTLQAVASSNKMQEAIKANPSSSQNTFFPNYQVFPGQFPNSQYPQGMEGNYDPSSSYRGGRTNQGPRGHKHFQNQQNQGAPQSRNNPGYRRKKDYNSSQNQQQQTPQNQQQNQQQTQQPFPGGRTGGRGGATNNRGGRNQPNTRGSRKRIPPPPNFIGEEEFPPLVSPKKGDHLRVYTRQEILDVVTQIKEVEKPSLPPATEIVLDKANFELEVTKPFPSTSTKKSNQQ